MFAPGHLGELTRIVPFEMVDAALADTGAVQQRLRLSALAGGGLSAARGRVVRRIGLSQVWTRLCAGLAGLAVAAPAPRRTGRRPGSGRDRAAAGAVRPAARPGNRLRAFGARTGGVLAGPAGHRCRRHHPVLPGHPGEPHRVPQGRQLHGPPGTRWSACWRWSPAAPARSSTRCSAPTGSANRLRRSTAGTTRAGMIVLADRNFAAATWITALADDRRRGAGPGQEPPPRCRSAGPWPTGRSCPGSAGSRSE